MAEKTEGQQPATETKQDKEALDLVTLKELYKDSVKGIVNLQEEDNAKLKPILQRIADENQSVLLSCIAPYGGRKVSPYDTVSASIRTDEVLGIDEALIDIDTILREREISLPTDLILLVNSPGGLVTSSYVIAKMIRDNFKKIKVVVPHTALSGGTMLALTGNEVIMGRMSRLSPIDTQLKYKNEWVSAQSFRRAIDRFEEYFKDKNEYEVPYIWRAMAEKFDPIIREEWDAELMQIWDYMFYILTKAGYDAKKMLSIVRNLVFPIYPHNFVVNDVRAGEYGINVKKDTDYPLIWNAMKAWFGLYYLQAESRHYIRYIVPNKKQ